MALSDLVLFGATLNCLCAEVDRLSLLLIRRRVGELSDRSVDVIDLCRSVAEAAEPGQPTDVTTTAFSKSVLVSWKPPEDGPVVRGYVVGYGEGVPDVSWQYLQPHRRNVTIRNLS